jgi:hypothetical protein
MLTRRPWPVGLIVLGLMIACGVLQEALAATAEDWREYRNERYGFNLHYPADAFTMERTSEAGDGQVFVSQVGNARLLVGALVNDSGFSPASYQEYIARRSYADYEIGYRRLGQGWFVLSGEGKGKVFYEKVMFSCAGRLINSFALLYSVAERAFFDPIVERIENTFRPGRDCEHAGLPAPPPPVQRTPRQYLSPTNAERSALADRIARARGRDVVVVLRRTTPPYDYRIVRGYASRP